MKTYKILKMLFQNILDNDSINIITTYYGKKWSKDFKPIKKIKVKSSKKGKNQNSFHYYYH